MKKAFAVMTTMLVALACFGFLTKAQVSAAESKIFTEDPTLAEDEIPMYIMDSIYSTFPNYYDNEENFSHAFSSLYALCFCGLRRRR